MKSIGQTVARLLVACCNCNRCKDQNGTWVDYSEDAPRPLHAMSHGICPECFKAIYPVRFHSLLDQYYAKTASAR